MVETCMINQLMTKSKNMKKLKRLQQDNETVKQQDVC